MKRLPFVLPPAEPRKRRCGTAASGVLEVPELGGLTVEEAAYISEVMAQEQSAFVRGAQIADAIAKGEGVSISEAFGVIESAIRGAELEPAAESIRLKYAAEIQEVSRAYSQAGQRSMAATVTALIRHRLELPDWTIEDTQKMPRALFTAVWTLAEDEQAAENADPVEPADEELLGKPPVASGSGRKRTGSVSHGT